MHCTSSHCDCDDALLGVQLVKLATLHVNFCKPSQISCQLSASTILCDSSQLFHVILHMVLDAHKWLFPVKQRLSGCSAGYLQGNSCIDLPFSYCCLLDDLTCCTHQCLEHQLLIHQLESTSKDAPQGKEGHSQSGCSPQGATLESQLSKV